MGNNSSKEIPAVELHHEQDHREIDQISIDLI